MEQKVSKINISWANTAYWATVLSICAAGYPLFLALQTSRRPTLANRMRALIWGENYDYNKDDYFTYSRGEGCRNYRSGIKIYDDGREFDPWGTIQHGPDGHRIQYIDPRASLPYVETRKVVDHQENQEHEAAPESSTLGAGLHGRVVKVKATSNGTSDRLFAQKEYLPQVSKITTSTKPEALINLETELKILNQLDEDKPTEHRVKVHDAYTVGWRSFFLVLDPVADGGTLEDLLFNFAFSPDTKTEEDVKRLRRTAGCLTVALASLHEKGYRHRDLHPRNVLLHKGEVKLCDFGISTYVAGGASSTTSTYFPPRMERYAAPEVISTTQSRNQQADLFPLGAMLFEIELAILDHEFLSRSFYDGGWRWEAHLDDVASKCEALHERSRILREVEALMSREAGPRPRASITAAKFYYNPWDHRGDNATMCAACEDWVTARGRCKAMYDTVNKRQSATYRAFPDYSAWPPYGDIGKSLESNAKLAGQG